MYKDRPRSLGQILEKRVRRVPQKEALVCEGTRWNYRDFDGRVNSLLAKRLGVQKGDRVSMLQGNSAEWALFFCSF
jgi:non-ribosomal peptide synthetase component E (peptide arylation enzyme)